MIDSYLAWWQDAGAADALGDAPFDWLTAPASVSRSAAVPASVAPANDRPGVTAATGPATAAAAIPTTLAEFDRWWLAEKTLVGGDWAGPRLVATGPANAPLMLLADVPDSDDLRAGHLFAGAAGELLDAMLAAIGLTRDKVRIGALTATRPAGGRIDPALSAALADLAMAHIRLAAPQRLILLGGQASLVLTGDQVNSSTDQYKINHPGATLAPYAIHHPRLLLERPSLKRHAWSVLKLFREPR